MNQAVLLSFSIFAAFLASTPLLSRAEEKALSEQEFAAVCAENHAEDSRFLRPPLKEEPPDAFNYEFHYREVLLSPDGESFVDNPYDTRSCRSLAGGQLIMDMEDGYEMSYEYHITGPESEGGKEYIAKGETVTPYYRAVPSGPASDPKKQYTYVSNAPRKLPVIPDFPKDYDWKKHQETTLTVAVRVAVRSLSGGDTYYYYSRISYITNLNKNTPDCYFLTPTDLLGYTVQKGDTLQKIAKKYCGSSGDWTYIWERNRDLIPDADAIYPGMLLVIPNIESMK